MSGKQVAHVRRMLQGLWPWILPPDQVVQRAIRSDSAQNELKDACRCVAGAGSLGHSGSHNPSASLHAYWFRHSRRALMLTLHYAMLYAH